MVAAAALYSFHIRNDADPEACSRALARRMSELAQAFAPCDQTDPENVPGHLPQPATTSPSAS
jgi:hypothetical protein